MQNNNVKQKKHYTVEVECLVPAIVKYRVTVEDGEFDQAIVETFKLLPITQPKLSIAKMRRISAKVYDWGTSIIRHIKKFN